MKSFSLLLAPLIFALGLSSCNQGKKESPKPDQVVRVQWSALTAETAAEAQIKVINQYGEPISQAQILIGQSQDNPFRGNFLTTDKNGIVALPKEWTNPAHVTVEANGYIRQTLLNQKPGAMVLKIYSRYLPQRAELNGQVLNLPIVNGDKLIDFGLVMPALQRSDILSFDLDQVISPFSDILSVATQKAPLPSNVSLPTQKENYIFNLTVSKPVYRLLVPTLGPKRFYAARGRFPFKPVVDDIRDNKAFYELLNHFTLSGGGLRDTNLLNSTTTLDLPANELDFKTSVQVQTASAQPDEVLLTLAVSEISGSLIPTDVKKSVPAQPQTLTSMANTTVSIVSVIKKEAEFMARTSGADRLSASIVPFKENEKQKLLPLVANPSIDVSSQFKIHLPPPPMTSGVYPLAISATISDLIETPDGDTKVVSANKRWDILGLGWQSDIQLPNWPLSAEHESTTSINKKRVSINFIGSLKKTNTNLDDSLIDAATHVSHASTDF